MACRVIRQSHPWLDILTLPATNWSMKFFVKRSHVLIESLSKIHTPCLQLLALQFQHCDYCSQYIHGFTTRALSQLSEARVLQVFQCFFSQYQRGVHLFGQYTVSCVWVLKRSNPRHSLQVEARASCAYRLILSPCLKSRSFELSSLLFRRLQHWVDWEIHDEAAPTTEPLTVTKMFKSIEKERRQFSRFQD